MVWGGGGQYGRYVRGERRIHTDIGRNGAQGGAFVSFRREAAGAADRMSARVWLALRGRLVVIQNSMSATVDLVPTRAYVLSHHMMTKVTIW
jgi:hypothetical protein